MINKQYFEYSEKETNYLIKKDKKLKPYIKKYGIIKREINPNIFSSIIYNIIGQQISTSSLDKIWHKFKNQFLQITPSEIINTDITIINKLGIPTRKIEYIKQIARLIQNKEFNPEAIRNLPDEEIIKQLTAFKGIGNWTAEMLLIFTLQRKNIFSLKDFALKKGLEKLHKTEITKAKFQEFKKLYSPYCTIASFYLWEIAKEQQ